MTCRTVSVIAAFFMTASFAFCDDGKPLWRGDVALNTDTGNQGVSSIYAPGVDMVDDGAGGTIVVWENSYYGNVQAQRVDATGKPLWATGGVTIAPIQAFEMGPHVASDGAGGAIIAWVDGRNGWCDLSFRAQCLFYAQRIDGNGVPLWGLTGVQISGKLSSGGGGIAIASDAEGGAILSFEAAGSQCCSYWAQRVDSKGRLLWGNDGIQISADPTHIIGATGHADNVLADGSGGALIAYLDQQVDPVTQIPHLSVQHVDPSGNLLLPIAGVPVLDVVRGEFSFVSDGAGGAFLIGATQSPDHASDISAQRIDATGAPMWPAPVAIVDLPYFQMQPDAAADGSGGVVVAWSDYRASVAAQTNVMQIYAQRLDGSGRVLWASNGVPVTVAALPDLPKLVSDGSGGAIVSWLDCRNYAMASSYVCGWFADMYAQRLDATTGAPMWPVNGVPVSTQGGNQGIHTGTQYAPSHMMLLDSNHGAFVVWPDGRNIPCDPGLGDSECDVYMQRISDQFGAAPKADLEVAVAMTPNPPVVYQDMTFTVRVKNHGPDTAHGVTLVNLPPLLANPKTTGPSQGSCMGTYWQGCALGDLVSGASANVVITMNTNNTGAMVLNSSVSATELDPVASNNATNSTATVASDFTYTTTTSSQTVKAGNPATYTLNLQSSTGNSLTSPVTFACGTMPGGTACSFSPSSIAAGNTNGTITLTISTAANTVCPATAHNRTPFEAPLLPVFAIALIGTAIKRHRRALQVLLMLAVLAAISACGGGGAKSPQCTPVINTRPGTYTVAVTASSGSVSHALSVTLVVQ